MKLFIIIFISSYVNFITTEPSYISTLETKFNLDVFIAYDSYFTMRLSTLPNQQVIASKTGFTAFKLINGVLSSDSSGATYYLKNQTGLGYPSYLLKKGYGGIRDISLFRATTTLVSYGRFVSPNIPVDNSPWSDNRWVACKTNDNTYTIGWDADITSQPPNGCINYAKYNPGVLLLVDYV